MQFDIGMLFVVIGISTCSSNTYYQIKYKNKNGKISKISRLIYKILRGMNTFLYGVFVSPHGGLGGPPSFFAC
jgi:hypothetical protein